MKFVLLFSSVSHSGSHFHRSANRFNGILLLLLLCFNRSRRYSAIRSLLYIAVPFRNSADDRNSKCVYFYAKLFSIPFAASLNLFSIPKNHKSLIYDWQGFLDRPKRIYKLRETNRVPKKQPHWTATDREKRAQNEWSNWKLLLNHYIRASEIQLSFR